MMFIEGNRLPSMLLLKVSASGMLWCIALIAIALKSANKAIGRLQRFDIGGRATVTIDFRLNV